MLNNCLPYPPLKCGFPQFLCKAEASALELIFCAFRVILKLVETQSIRLTLLFMLPPVIHLLHFVPFLCSNDAYVSIIQNLQQREFYSITS